MINMDSSNVSPKHGRIELTPEEADNLPSATSDPIESVKSPCADAKKLATSNQLKSGRDEMGELISAPSISSIAQNQDASPLGLKISNVTSLKETECETNSNINYSGFSSVDENLLQLSNNVLSPYCSPVFPDEFLKAFPAPESFPCNACGDTFVLKSSLSFHLQRRSVHIKFSCDSCKGVIIFYNRCSLLSHIKLHTDKGEPSNIKNAYLTPLPFSLMEGIKENSAISGEEHSDNMNVDTAQAETGKRKLNVMQESALETSKPVVEKPIAEIKCFDCGTSFKSIKLRADHLTNNDSVPLMISPCNKCSILCPSKCSFKAHQRIHLQIGPYSCPECGILLDSSWEIFLKHLKYECFHFSRSVGYKCPVCDLLLNTPSVLQKHMLDLHTESYFKCQTCPMAFKTSLSFQNHKKTVHPNSNSVYKVIFKCALCDVVCVGKDQLSFHVDIHIKDQMCQYIFNCRECSVSTNSKVELYAHLKNRHEKLLYDETSVGLMNENNCSTDTTGGSFPWSKVAATLQKVDCILCHCSFLTRQGYNIHVTRAHNSGKLTCSKCSLIFDKRMKIVEHGKKHITGGCVLCLLCQNKEFKDQDSLDIHLFQHVEKINFQSYCPLCDIPLWNVEDAWKHIREEHGLNYSHKRGNQPIVHSGEKIDTNKKTRYCDICKLTFGSWEQWKQHILKVHKMKNKAANSSERAPTHANNARVVAITGEVNERGSDEPYSKNFKPLENLCAKCDFKSKCQSTFRTHILKHKNNKSTFQCLECGLCFIVEPSLKKHLKIAHKIGDVEKYLLDEGTNYIPADPPSETQAHNSLECSVCFTMFPTESSLKTHLRSHGMAFIQANKISS